MKEKIIKIRDDEEYITLNIALKLADVIQTGGQAKIYLAENKVMVNDESENRRGRKLYPNDAVKTENILIKITK